MNFRVGFGYDVHQLQEGSDFWIGGVKLDHSKGAVGHSDADVLLHAITDAILGAANLGDIGQHFPDTDPAYKGADSVILLKGAMDLVNDKGYEIGNVDCTVCLEKPKVGPHIPGMAKIIADTLNTDVDNVSIKATTSEKMGFVGKEEGVAAYAVALIKSA